MQKEIIWNSRILIVDDQAANVKLLERVLRQKGYQHVNFVTDSREVLPLFTVVQPDLILLDLMMPNIDGFSLLTQLRSRIPEDTYLPVLVLTADISREAKEKALSLGAKDFLTKPFDTTEVILRIHNLLETRFLHLKIQEQNKALREQVEEHGRELQKVHLAVLGRLARDLGLPEPQIEAIRQAARRLFPERREDLNFTEQGEVLVT